MNQPIFIPRGIKEFIYEGKFPEFETRLKPLVLDKKTNSKAPVYVYGSEQPIDYPKNRIMRATYEKDDEGFHLVIKDKNVTVKDSSALTLLAQDLTSREYEINLVAGKGVSLRILDPNLWTYTGSMDEVYSLLAEKYKSLYSRSVVSHKIVGNIQKKPTDNEDELKTVKADDWQMAPDLIQSSTDLLEGIDMRNRLRLSTF